jgi:cyclohexanone monooxygenase
VDAARRLRSDRAKRYSQPTIDAEAAWVAEIRRLAVGNVEFFEACTPGYYNNEGKLAQRTGGLNGEAYAPGANAFNALLAQWREKGDLEGLEIG